MTKRQLNTLRKALELTNLALEEVEQDCCLAKGVKPRIADGCHCYNALVATRNAAAVLDSLAPKHLTILATDDVITVKIKGDNTPFNFTEGVMTGADLAEVLEALGISHKYTYKGRR